MDADLLATYFRHFVDSGFLPEPPAAAVADAATAAERLVAADPIRR